MTTMPLAPAPQRLPLGRFLLSELQAQSAAFSLPSI